LRKKYKAKGQLDATKDGLIWRMEIKRLQSDIDYAANQVEELKKVLIKLQKNCLTT